MSYGKLVSFALVGALSMLAGCAHAIKIVPDVTRIDQIQPSNKIEADVGYFIPEDLSSIEVTTAGGGGDNVRYFPYKDIEPGLHIVLTNVFRNAHRIQSMSAADTPTGGAVEYLVQPTIVTTSGGSGLFTWPPTNFGVDLTCTIRDGNGTILASPRVVGVGSADTSERIHEFGIAGRRAMEDALIKLQAALLELPFLKSPPAAGPVGVAPETGEPVESRLARLKELVAKGLITSAEYEEKRKAIVDTL